MNEFLKQSIKSEILKSFSNAKHAHNEIFKDEPDNAVVIGHLSIATSYIGSAKSIYVCNYDEFGRNEFDEYFSQFDIFVKEVMTNTRTDHSHQWSDIEFTRLNEKYYEVAGLLDIKLS